MKFLHTGDWHVGKSVGGRSRAEDHRAVLAEIVEVARAEDVEATIVAGDLFDSASPAPEAEDIVYNALLGLSQVAPVVVIAGNHDNQRRLAALAALFDLANVTVRPYIASNARPLELASRAGERVNLALLPWLSQRHVLTADHLMDNDAAELSGRFGERMRRIIELLTSCFTPDAINILVAHVTIAGSELGGGERPAQTIFDYFVEASSFPGSAHYVALGHIHKMQKLAGACPIYYSGSPLQLDFADSDSSKHVLVVDAGAGRPAEVQKVPLRSGRKLKTLQGTLRELNAVAGSASEDFLRVILHERHRAGLGDEVRTLFPHAVKVLVETPNEDARAPKRLERVFRTPTELFAEYLADRNVDDRRLIDLFRTLYEKASA